MARIEQSIEVNVPVRAAYDQLTRFEQYPRFMGNVDRVRQLDDTHLHLCTRAGNLDMEWDAEITQQVPDQCIAWRNTGQPRYAGKLELQALAPDKTRVAVSIDCEHGQQILAQHGDAERALAQRAEHDLARFKKFMEGLRHERGAAPEQRPASEPLQQEEAPRAGAGERSWMPNLMQLWSQPLSVMRMMSEEMDQLVGKFVGRPSQLSGKPRGAPSAGGWAPAVEIAHGENTMVICAELPGVGRDDVHVEVKNDRVTIEGERHPAQQAQDVQRSERSYGHFYRVIALPEGAEPDAAMATLHDGVLEITVPVPEGGRRARRVDIRAR